MWDEQGSRGRGRGRAPRLRSSTHAPLRPPPRSAGAPCSSWREWPRPGRLAKRGRPLGSLRGRCWAQPPWGVEGLYVEENLWNRPLILLCKGQGNELQSQGVDPHPPPLPLGEGRQGRNHLNEKFSPPPPHWDRRAVQPNHIKSRTCSRCELPL